MIADGTKRYICDLNDVEEVNLSSNSVLEPNCQLQEPTTNGTNIKRKSLGVLSVKEN